MLVTQVCIGRFHHFHLARQLERYGLLEEIWTGYPKFALKDEQGISESKIRTFPWLQAPYMKRGKFGLDRLKWLNREWAWHSQQALDRVVASRLDDSKRILVGLSGSGLISGQKVQKNGGYFICDRGSSHISYQNDILHEEYQRWGLKFEGIDPRIIAKENAEYEVSDKITVPSKFVENSFIEKGVNPDKIERVTYGARLDRFEKIADPVKDKFTVLWVGAISIRKGFLYALRAFELLRHPGKEFLVIGGMTDEIKRLLHNKNLSGVSFLGNVRNTELPKIYSSSHVFLPASVEEGLAMVQGEALACGCPVIATPNTGAEDLFEDGNEGFIVPIRCPELILERLQRLADDRLLREEMSFVAIERVKSFGGWNAYGDRYVDLLKTLKS